MSDPENRQHDFDGYGMCRYCGRGNLEVGRGEAPKVCTTHPGYHAAILDLERRIAALDAEPGKEEE